MLPLWQCGFIVFSECVYRSLELLYPLYHLCLLVLKILKLEVAAELLNTYVWHAAIAGRLNIAQLVKNILLVNAPLVAGSVTCVPEERALHLGR